MTMQELRWEMANICVDDHAKDGLKQGTLVQILYRWEQDLFPGEPSLGKGGHGDKERRGQRGERSGETWHTHDDSILEHLAPA